MIALDDILLPVVLALAVLIAFLLGLGVGHERGYTRGRAERSGAQSERPPRFEDPTPWAPHQPSGTMSQTSDVTRNPTIGMGPRTAPRQDPPAAAGPGAPVSAGSPPPPPARPTPVPPPSEESRIAHLYNDDPEALRQAYDAVRFGVTNAVELLRKPETPPVFDRSDNGTYWLIRKGPEAAIGYVVPRGGLVVSSAEFAAGGMDVVFGTTPPFRRGSRYRQIQVMKPAKLQLRSGAWEVVARGELALGAEESEA